jgi:hypothetical protein
MANSLHLLIIEFKNAVFDPGKLFQSSIMLVGKALLKNLSGVPF